jgi:predicted MPP superfamily phosphohydrolase
LFVSRGVGITGPPARLFCPAEVDLLVIESAV